jgi:hypothetical protein
MPKPVIDAIAPAMIAAKGNQMFESIERSSVLLQKELVTDQAKPGDYMWSEATAPVIAIT